MQFSKSITKWAGANCKNAKSFKYDPDQIIKMLNLSQNELEKITKMRRIKNYNDMSKEELLITLLKSKPCWTSEK